MLYTIKRAFKRLLKKESIYFIEDAELEQYILDGKAKCSRCNNPITSVEDIYKIKLRNKETIFFCKSCPEELNK